MSEFWFNVVLALSGGLLPSLIWLTFWLKQDELHPEPKKLVIISFCLGAATVPAAAVIQTVVANILVDTGNIHIIASSAPSIALIVIIIWAISEEILKLIAAYAGGLWSQESDEPMDITIYLVAAALGFASLENILYVAGPLISGDLPTAIMTGPSRFVGATTLHAASAACLGAFAGFAKFKRFGAKLFMWVTGFIAASTLHIAFNASIMFGSEKSPVAYTGAWIATLLVIIAFEYVRSMRVEAIRRRKEKINRG